MKDKHFPYAAIIAVRTEKYSYVLGSPPTMRLQTKQAKISFTVRLSADVTAISDFIKKKNRAVQVEKN